MPNWQKVEAPRGSYIGWGSRTGQHVTGTVVDYDEHGGTDYAGKPCPLLEIELTERAASFDKELNRTNFDAGELVMLTCGQTALKRHVKKAEPKRGDLIQIKLDRTEKSANGTVKLFDVQIARGQGKVSESVASNGDGRDDFAQEPPEDEEPPF